MSSFHKSARSSYKPNQLGSSLQRKCESDHYVWNKTSQQASSWCPSPPPPPPPPCPPCPTCTSSQSTGPSQGEFKDILFKKGFISWQCEMLKDLLYFQSRQKRFIFGAVANLLRVRIFSNIALFLSSSLLYQACALRALGLLLADGTPTVGRGKTF